jgi:hypothetical protein
MWQIHVAGDPHAQNANNNVRLADNAPREKSTGERVLLMVGTKAECMASFLQPITV